MVLIDVESENGWRPPDLRPGDPLLVWKTIPGCDPPVTIQVMRGLPEVFLPAWVADWNAYIEPVRDDDTAAYTDGNRVYTSNHKNGTAVDIDWRNHEFQRRGTLNADQMKTLAQMEDFYEGWVFWAGRWDDPVDEMHSQMGYVTWNRNTAALNFIARKIRSDGFSTFRRGPLSPTDPPNAGGQPAGPTPDTQDADDAVQVLYDAVPIIDEDRAAELADRIVDGLALADCTNVSRIAMWLAQIGWESDGFNATEEYEKNGRYAPYIGRTWIQITWQENYQKFGQWAHGQGLIDDPNFFVNNPQRLADDRWAAIGPAWYWTVARPTINQLSDTGDLVAVTRLINGGANGLDEPNGRRARYQQAIALGDRLLLCIHATTKGPLMALTDAEQQEMLTKVREIWDQLRGPDGNGWPQLGQTSDGQSLTLVDAIAAIGKGIQGLLALAPAPVKKAPPKKTMAKKAAPRKRSS